MTKSVAPDRNTSDTLPSGTLLDHSVLLSSVDGDMDLLRGISGLFLSSYPALISDMRDAIARDDSNALARAAHTFKGSGGYFLTDAAREGVVELELIAHGSDLSVATERLAELELEMERLKPELSIFAAEAAQSHGL
jgi:HPt (histidine-containing phosphotransfer) domain-containing protein